MNFIELCCGSGGMTLGFINKGYNPVMVNDIDKRCCMTIKKNFKNINVVCGSMVNIDLSRYDFDILIGGVPCQSWSYCGKCEGLDDNRGILILEFIKTVKNYYPKVFVIENVKGLLTHNHGKTFEYIKSQIPNSYNVYYKVLNANNYCVAQKRLRLFIIGVRKSINKVYRFPEPQTHKPILKDIIGYAPLSEGAKYSPHKFDIMKQIPEGGCWINLPEDIQKKYMGGAYNSSGGRRGYARRLSMNKPSPTILTNPNQKQTEFCHPKETRPINIIESARIQSFPDSYKFVGSMAQQYKQIGNAVPVKLSEAIAESLLLILK